jgi:hypothetical protein
MEGLGLAACADLYSWLLREAPVFPAIALRANKHWLMYSFSCPARSAPSCVRPRSRGRSCVCRRCRPCAKAVCLCALSRCDFAAGAKRYVRKPCDAESTAPTARKRDHAAQTARRCAALARTADATPAAKTTAPPTTLRESTAVRVTALARPNVRHERRQKGEAFLTSARWRG